MRPFGTGAEPAPLVKNLRERLTLVSLDHDTVRNPELLVADRKTPLYS